jgi:hypothetical protein
MKRFWWLVVLVGIAGAGGAWAKPTPQHPHARPRAVVALAHVSYRHGHRTAGHTGHAAPARVHAAAPAATASERTLALMQDPAGPPQHPGWFKGHDEAGWGFAQGRTETVVGLYRRPDEPQLPGPQIYHQPEGRGAAGLSISLKLGH